MPEMSLINEKEVLYHRKQFQEALKIQGIKATLSLINRSSKDIYDFYGDINDPDITYDKNIRIKILFEEVPQIRTLKSLGWYIEDESLPYIAYLPTTYNDEEGNDILITPIIDDVITLRDNPIDNTRSLRKYQIKDLRGMGYPNTIYYIAKLAPYRENLK